MADKKQPRYRVTDKRAYIKFGDVQVDAGDLVQMAFSWSGFGWSANE